MNEIKLVAVVGAAITAKKHELAIRIKPVRKAEPWLDRAIEDFSFGTGRDVIVDVVVRVDEIGIVFRLNSRHSRRIVHVIEEIWRALEVPANAEIERQPIRDIPVVLNVGAKLESL